MTAETSNARGEWVLVPREPTGAMIDAWRDAPDIWEAAYAAMLAAAPPPPSAPAGVDAPGSRAWMAEVCRAAALSLAAHGVRNDQLSKVADWITQQPAAAEPKTLPVPTRVHLIGETAVIVGTPGRGWDEEGPEAHNCDAMGCPTIGPHVLARVPFTDERALTAAQQQAVATPLPGDKGSVQALFNPTLQPMQQGGGEVVQRLRGVLEHGKMGDKCLIAPDLVTAAIASLSAQQSPAEAQPVEVFNCPNCPVAVRSQWREPDCPECGERCFLDQTAKPAAPPSASVGVEGYLVERLHGDGYGPARVIVDAAIYDPTNNAFWSGPEAQARHRVTPLVPALAQQPAAAHEPCAAVAAIQFALTDQEGMTFLRLWNEGEFDTLRREWPDAPSEVYVGADPLAAQRQEPTT